MLAALKAAERRRVSTPYRKLEAMKEEERALARELEQLRRAAPPAGGATRPTETSATRSHAPAGAQSFMAPWLEKRGEAARRGGGGGGGGGGHHHCARPSWPEPHRPLAAPPERGRAGGDEARLARCVLPQLTPPRRCSASSRRRPPGNPVDKRGVKVPTSSPYDYYHHNNSYYYCYNYCYCCCCCCCCCYCCCYCCYD